jgi:putative endonuclease
MAQHNETGRKGEAMAFTFLIDNDYIILETNWRVGRAEVDIIARKGGVLVIIEVKTRSSEYFGKPFEFIPLKKWRLLSDAAYIYAEQAHHDGEIRFDIISVILYGPQSGSLQHFKDAYFDDFISIL